MKIFSTAALAIVLSSLFATVVQAKMNGTHDGKTCVVHFADGTPQGVGCGHGATCHSNGRCEVKVVGNPDKGIDKAKASKEKEPPCPPYCSTGPTNPNKAVSQDLKP